MSNLTITIDGLESDLWVARFEAREGVSDLFQVDLLLVCDIADAIEIDAVLGKAACFTIAGVTAPRHFHGVIVRFEQVDMHARSIGYVATIAPRVHRLQHRYDCRVFQAAEGASITVKDIIPQVLEAANL